MPKGRGIRAEYAMDFLDGYFACLNETDKGAPYRGGKMYLVDNGVLVDEHGRRYRGLRTIGDLAAVTGVRWMKVKSIYPAAYTIHYTGHVLCISSVDPKVFSVGTVYPVLNGVIDVQSYSARIDKDNGKDFCEELYHYCGSRFIPIVGMQKGEEEE